MQDVKQIAQDSFEIKLKIERNRKILESEEHPMINLADEAMTIKLDYDLPEYPKMESCYRRAPRRESHLTEADKALAIKNALVELYLWMVLGVRVALGRLARRQRSS